eukprot:g763.t1
MDVGETVRLNSDRLQEIIGTSVALETRMIIQKLDPSATETTITLSTLKTQDQVSLPAVLNEQLRAAGVNDTDDVKVFITSTDDATAAGIEAGKSSTIVSRIVSINIRVGTNLTKVSVTQLTSPVRIKLYPRGGKPVSDTMACVWRNESTIGTGRPWREEGCSRVASAPSDTFVVCECHHLTEFALTERDTEGGGMSAQTTIVIAAGVITLVLLLVAALFARIRKAASETVDSVLGSPGAVEAAMKITYQALWGTLAQMTLLAPTQMYPGVTKQVVLRMEPKAKDKNEEVVLGAPPPGLGQVDKATSGTSIPHGTKVEATIRVGERDAFELRAGEEVTKSFIWQGKMERLQWYLKSKATAKAGEYVGAVIVNVKWGKDSQQLSHDITVAGVATVPTVVNPMQMHSRSAEAAGQSMTKAELKQSIRKAKLEALKNLRTEPLTKLLNRAAFDDDVGTISPTERVCIMNIDLTALGFANDAMGHEGANDAIKYFAKEIKAKVKNWHEGGSLPNKQSTVYRQGGDEFAVICYPKAEYTHDHAHLDRLVEALAAITFIGRGTESKHKGVECHSWLRIGAVWTVGATIAEADALEAKVKRSLLAAGARLAKGKPAPSLEEVWKLQSGSARNYQIDYGSDTNAVSDGDQDLKVDLDSEAGRSKGLSLSSVDGVQFVEEDEESEESEEGEGAEEHGLNADAGATQRQQTAINLHTAKSVVEI